MNNKQFSKMVELTASVRANPKRGDLIKIHIPGETPWAEVTELVAPGYIRASIQSYVGKGTAVEDMLKGHGQEVLHDHQILDVVDLFWREDWKMFSTERE